MTLPLTPCQCRAGRGFLNWTLEDLSQASHISRISLNNFEQGKGNLKADTTDAIVSAFETAGVEFIPFGIIHHDGKMVMRRWIKNAINNLIADIKIASNNEEVLSCGLHTIFNSLDIDDVGLLELINTLEKTQKSARIVHRNGDRNFLLPPNIATYRWTDLSLTGSPPYIIYGDTVALFMSKPTPSLMVAKNTVFSTDYRMTFNNLWDLAGPIPFTSDEIQTICQATLGKYNKVKS